MQGARAPRLCGRDAAEAACREFLRKQANRFARDARVEAEVCPEIEWSPAVSRGDDASQDPA